MPVNLEFNRAAYESAIILEKLKSETEVIPREVEGEERSSDLVQSSEDIVYLVPCRWSTIQQNETVSISAMAMCYDADLCNPLTCTER